MKKSLTPPALIVGHSGDAADMRYACGFTPVDPVLFLNTGRKRHLVVPMLEVGRARQEAGGCTIHTPATLGLALKDRRRLSGWAIGLLKTTGIAHVRVGSFFPAGLWRALQQAGVRVELVEGGLFPQRIIKSAEEVEKIEGVQRAAVEAMRRAVAEIRSARVNRNGILMRGNKCLTAEDVALIIECELLRHQCQARDTIVACGRQAADPHDRGRGPLRAGQTIVLDIFPQHKRHGYWGDITRTVVKGTASPHVRKMYAAVRDAQRAALAMMKPGARADRIHARVESCLKDSGFVTEVRAGVPVGFFHGTGHGVGLEIHEAPSLSMAPVRLRAGQVVTVEPGLYYPEWGGVRIEDTVEVTRDGARILCPCEKVLEI